MRVAQLSLSSAPSWRGGGVVSSASVHRGLPHAPQVSQDRGACAEPCSPSSPVLQQSHDHPSPSLCGHPLQPDFSVSRHLPTPVRSPAVVLGFILIMKTTFNEAKRSWVVATLPPVIFGLQAWSRTRKVTSRHSKK